MRAFSLQQLAYSVWNLIAVANRTVGAAASVTGAVGSVTGAVGSLTTNNDKTGYSLTAGSYSVRASSTQRALITDSIAGPTATISSVTTTRAQEVLCGVNGLNAAGDFREIYRMRLTAATTITANKSGTANQSDLTFTVQELF